MTFTFPQRQREKTGAGRGINVRLEREKKKKKSLRFEMRQQKEHEGGMFSKNTHVLRNHTRTGRERGRKHMRVCERVNREWVSRYSQR